MDIIGFTAWLTHCTCEAASKVVPSVPIRRLAPFNGDNPHEVVCEYITGDVLQVSLARLLFRGGDHKGAVQLYNEVISMKGYTLDPASLLWYGKALCSADQTENGIKVLLEAMSAGDAKVWSPPFITLLYCIHPK